MFCLHKVYILAFQGSIFQLRGVVAKELGTRARSVDQGPHKPSKTWFSLSNKLVLVRENLDFSWFGSGPWDVFVEDKPF